MATENKILGQSSPAANTNASLYVVPALSSAEGVLLVCNRGAKPAKFRVAVTVNTGTLANKDYLYFDKIIPNGETIVIEGLKLATGDFVTVRASREELSFNLIGTLTT